MLSSLSSSKEIYLPPSYLLFSAGETNLRFLILGATFFVHSLSNSVYLVSTTLTVTSLSALTNSSSSAMHTASVFDSQLSYVIAETVP